MPFDPDAFLVSDAKKPSFDPDAFLGARKPRKWREVLADAPAAAFGEIGSTIGGAAHAATSLFSGPNEERTKQDAAAGKFMPLEIARTLLSRPDPANVKADARAGNFSPAGGHYTPFTAMAQGDTEPMKEAIAKRPLGLLGDVVGAAGLTPAGRRAIGAVTDFAMSPVRRAAHAIADLPPVRRAQARLLEASRVENGDPQTLAAALEGNVAPAPGVPYSAAQATQNPAVTALERQSRGAPQTAPGWANFDTAQNTSMVNALQGVVGHADDAAVIAAREARDAATGANRRVALALADQGGMEGAGIPGMGEAPHGMPNPRAGALRAVGEDPALAGQGGLEPHSLQDRGGLFEQSILRAVGEELAGNRGALPSVRSTANYVSDPASIATAGRAYETRKMLTDALNAKTGVPLDEIASAAKSGGVSTRAMRDAIDTSLDRASGGAWREYLNSFRDASRNVDNTQALNNIRAELEAKIAGGGVDGMGNPKLSRAFIHQVIEGHSTNKYGQMLSPDSQRRLNDIRSTAQQLEAPNINYRSASTGGGGSDTFHNAALSGAGHLLTRALGPVGRLATSVASGVAAPLESATNLRVADLLRNPQQAATALREAAARDAARRGRRSTGTKAAALAAALAAQPQQ